MLKLVLGVCPPRYLRSVSRERRLTQYANHCAPPLSFFFFKENVEKRTPPPPSRRATRIDARRKSEDGACVRKIKRDGRPERAAGKRLISSIYMQAQMRLKAGGETRQRPGVPNKRRRGKEKKLCDVTFLFIFFFDARVRPRIDGPPSWTRTLIEGVEMRRRSNERVKMKPVRPPAPGVALIAASKG